MKILEILEYSGFCFVLVVFGYLSELLLLRNVFRDRCGIKTPRLQEERLKIVFTLVVSVVLWGLYIFSFCNLIVPLGITSFALGIAIALKRKPSDQSTLQLMTKGTNMIQITKGKFLAIIVLNFLAIAAALGLSVFLSSHRLNSSKGVPHDQWSRKVDASTNTKAMKELLEADDSYIRVLEYIVNNYHEKMSLALVLISLLPIASLGILISSKFKSPKR